MNDEELAKVLKNFNISNEINIENFFEHNIRTVGDYIDYTTFESEFKKYYSSNSSLVDKYMETLSSQIFNKANETKIWQIFVLCDIYKMLNKKMLKPFFCFCYISALISNKLKENNFISQTALEFIVMNKLSIEEEININQFDFSIAKPLGLDELTTWIVFFSLDIEHRRKISISDFVSVIDSFIENNSDSAPAVGENLDELNEEQMKTIKMISSLCIEKGLHEADLYNNATNSSTNEIKSEKLKKTMKNQFGDRISDKELDNFISIFNDKVTFPQFNNVFTKTKYNVLSTSTKENFAKFQERLHRLPVKDNVEVFNKIYYAIMKIIKSHYTKPKETEKKQPTVESKEKNKFNERRALIDKNVQDETNKWNIIDLFESLIITNNQIYISSYELYDYISKRGNLSKESAFSLISILDKDKDGYVSYLDIINYLLTTLTYKSVVLSWRYISNFVNLKDISILSLFNEDNNIITINDTVEKEIFIKKFKSTFDINTAILILMYEKMQEVIMKNYKRNVIVNDIIININKQNDNTKDINRKRKFKNPNEKINYECQKIINTFFTTENIQLFTQLKETVTMSEYKDNFLIKCNFDYPNGVLLFFKLKEEKDNFIYTKKLYEYISSNAKFYSDKFYLRNMLKILNNKYTEDYFILCLETVPYVIEGVSSFDIMKMINVFYPSLSNQIVYHIVKRIDIEEKGVISYNNIINFIEAYTKCKLTYNFLLKVIASYLDVHKINTKDYLSQNILINENEIITIENSDKVFSKIFKLKESQIEFFFNNNHITLSQLIKDVDFIRLNISDNTEINTETINQFEELFKAIGIKFDDIDTLNITTDLEISVNELFTYIKNKIKQKQLTNESEILKKLILILKSFDKESKGLIKYEKIFTLFNIRNAKWHMKFISLYVLIKFNGDLNKYIKYKNVTNNQFLTKEEYEFIFIDEEMKQNQYISDEIFLTFQTQSMFSIYSYLNYIKKIEREVKFKKYNDEDIELIIKSEIQRYESEHYLEKKSFYSLYDNIEVNNSFGKVLCSKIKSMLSSQTKMKERYIYVFLNKFSNGQFILFDLLSFTNVIQKYTFYKISLKSIKQKITDESYNDTSSLTGKANLCKFANMMKDIFNLSLYETIIIFDKLYYKNKDTAKRVKSIYEINLDDFCKYCDIEPTKIKNEDSVDESNSEDKKEINILSKEIMKKIPGFRLKKGKKQKSKESLYQKRHRAQIGKAFRKFALKVKIASQDDLDTFFTTYDANQNGYISRDELLNILNSFGDLSENEKMLMVNYVDENNLDDISIQKFINVIQSIEFSQEEYDMIQNEIEKEKNKFKSQINFKQLQSVYLSNKQKYKAPNNIKKCSKEEIFDYIMFSLQSNIYDNFTEGNTIEKSFYDISIQNSSKVIPQIEFINIINETLSYQIDTDTSQRLIDIAFSDSEPSIKKSLLKQKLIPYLPFVDFVISYKITEDTKAQKKVKAEISDRLNLLYKKRNIQFGKFLKLKLDLNKEKDVIQIKTVLLNTFTFGSNTAKRTINEKEMYYFKNFLQKIDKSALSGINYEIKDSDYYEYITDNGNRKSMTIFNNERAALKKCEMIYNSLKENEKFFDEEFGSWPEDKDPSNKMGKSSIYFSLAPKGQVDPSLIEWYRIDEISKNPQFLCNTSDSSEVVQGALGDCWFISALAAISTKDHLIRGEFHESILEDGNIDNEETLMLSSGVYPPIFHYFRTKGIYCFRFYKNFKWRYVVIDDRLPCMKVIGKAKRPKVLYSKCRNTNEFWVSLIEKAYAKLHGCYEAIVSGCIDDGIVDLTGQESFRISLDLLQQHNIPDDRLWNIIKNYNRISIKQAKQEDDEDVITTKSNTIMLCSVEADTNHQEICFEDEKMGLLFNHGYPILNAIEIPKLNGKHRQTSRLIRMKNSWGFKSWNGKWAMASEEYEKNKEELIKALREIDENAKLSEPGTFFMCFNDFRKIITKLYLGIEFYPNYVGFYYDDHWSDVLPSALPWESEPDFFNNPQYYINIKEKTKLFIDIAQQDPRIIRQSGNYFPFERFIRKNCLVIIKASNGKSRLTQYKEEDIIMVSPVRQHKDNSLHRPLQPGEYILIPCNCTKGKGGNFRLSIYVEDKIDESKGVINFMNRLKKVYVCKLPNEKDKDDININPVLIREYSKTEIEKEKDEKKNILVYQLKKALDSQKEEEITFTTNVK